jgi:hypothetical protein
LRRASWFIDDRLVSGREDLFAYDVCTGGELAVVRRMRGRTRGSGFSGFAITASELLRTRELLQRQRPSPPAVVLDVSGGTGVHAAWLAGRGYLRCSRTQLDNVVVNCRGRCWSFGRAWRTPAYIPLSSRPNPVAECAHRYGLGREAALAGWPAGRLLIRLLDEAARDSSLVLDYQVEGLGRIERGRGHVAFLVAVGF